MNIPVKTKKEVEIMRRAGKILAQIMDQLWEMVEPGVKTSTLDKKAIELCKKFRVEPAFLGYKTEKHPFPAAICACINEEVVHGVPSPKKIVENGDLFTIDMGVKLQGWFSDMAVSQVVGQASSEAANIVKAANDSLKKAIEQCVPGNQLKDISTAIYNTAKKYRCTPMIEFVGHGIGQKLHEDPPIPGYWIDGVYENITLEKNMIFAIEAILTSGKSVEANVSKSDHWTAWPKDKALTACAEKTVAIDDPPKILTM